jgi:peroxiredoxin
MLIKKFYGVILALALFSLSARAADELIGTKAAEWTLGEWINSQPLTLKDLGGKVVLVRWWTAPECPYCKATAPVLNEFNEKYQERGLLIVGAYHHKSKSPLNPEEVKQFAEKYGFKFPIAIDRDWKTLKQWWLDGAQRPATSVSFLIDRHGVIRHIHPGPQIIKGEKDFEELDAQIQKLLAEK